MALATYCSDKEDVEMVLLVDDDEIFRNALAENLREDGHPVLECAAPAEVPPLDTLDGVRVVITDYDMPKTTGLAFADTFHAVHPSVPILLVTALPAQRIHADASRRAFVRLLQKPIDYSELRDILLDLRQPA